MNEKFIGEAYETEREIVIGTPVGYELSGDHNCDAMGCERWHVLGCGQWHVLYRFTKPPLAAADREYSEIQKWADTCAEYEKMHSVDGNVAKMEFYRGAKEAYRRVVGRMVRK